MKNFFKRTIGCEEKEKITTNITEITGILESFSLVEGTMRNGEECIRGKAVVQVQDSDIINHVSLNVFARKNLITGESNKSYKAFIDNRDILKPLCSCSSAFEASRVLVKGNLLGSLPKEKQEFEIGILPITSLDSNYKHSYAQFELDKAEIKEVGEDFVILTVFNQPLSDRFLKIYVPFSHRLTVKEKWHIGDTVYLKGKILESIEPSIEEKTTILGNTVPVITGKKCDKKLILQDGFAY